MNIYASWPLTPRQVEELANILQLFPFEKVRLEVLGRRRQGAVATAKYVGSPIGPEVAVRVAQDVERAQALDVPWPSVDKPKRRRR